MDKIEIYQEQLILNEKEASIHTLYNKFMQGFDASQFPSTSDMNEEGDYNILYAPGYEEFGLGDIVAQSSK